MLKIARSPAPRPNSVLKEVRRKPSEDNTAYVAAHASSAKQASHIVLLGGVGPLDFRLRAAQAHVRDDLAPSAWSHVLLLGAPAKDPAKTVAYEIALYGRAGVGFPPATNGVAKTTLGEYRDPKLFPNIAVLEIPVAFAAVTEIIERFKHQRSTVDALEHLLGWWSYVWGVGRTPNPLLDSLGIPAAIFAEYVFAAAGYDLVPGFPSRSSCPEAIWLSARWWFSMPRITDDETEQGQSKHAINGAYDAQHYLVPVT